MNHRAVMKVVFDHKAVGKARVELDNGEMLLVDSVSVTQKAGSLKQITLVVDGFGVDVVTE